jgi:hypothetical protein
MKDAVLLRVSDITGDERQIEQLTPVLTGTARRRQAPVFLAPFLSEPSLAESGLATKEAVVGHPLRCG